MTYYNDNEGFVCAWMENAAAAGQILPGVVDDRDIREVQPEDLEGFERVHLFAGIAGWDLALWLAGWPDDGPVWTASCPCPPFSVAGKQLECPECEGKDLVWCPRRTGYCICARCENAWLADARHLWPEVWRLISFCRPPVVFGEQVASVDGRDWLSGVRASLEILGYAVARRGSASFRRWSAAPTPARLVGGLPRWLFARLLLATCEAIRIRR